MKPRKQRSVHNKRKEKRIYHSNESIKYGKRQQTPNYYPYYYGRSRSQLLIPKSESFCIIPAMSSRNETARRSSALQKEKRKTKYSFKQVRKVWRKCQRTPNYHPNSYGHSQGQLLSPRRENFFNITTISSIK